MAAMYPSRLPAGLPSRAEERLFELIRRDLGDDWIGLHSVGVATHPAKPWAEIDFVLIGPAGVFCLEVKGGRIARQAGEWLYTDRHGHTATSREGPFEQVAPAAVALHKHLAGRLDWFREAAAGHGVITPDVTFKVSGPDVERRLVYDRRDARRPFSAYVGRLAAYWHERLRAQRGRPVLQLGARERAAVLAELRGDFDLRPSLRQQAGLAKEELLALTREQYEVLDGLLDNPRAVIRGGAGTGKTLLAAEEARRRAARGERVLLCCYNRRLGLYLQQALRDCPGVTAGHLHGLMDEAIHEAGLAGRLPPAEGQEFFTVHQPRVCVQALFALDRLEAYDAVIVDEGQDLLQDTYLEVLDTLLAGGLESGQWRIFLDPNQDIFGATAEAARRRLASAHPARYTLTINCRNTGPIAAAATRVSGVDCGRTRVDRGPDVQLYWYRDPAHQRREISRCLQRLLSERFQPWEIVVLSHHRRENSCLADGLEGVPFPLVEVDGPPAAPPEPLIRYYTIQAFKGLEADVVLVFDLDDLETPDALLCNYVGASRARALLALFLDEGVRGAYQARASDPFPRPLPRRGEGEVLS